MVRTILVTALAAVIGAISPLVVLWITAASTGVGTSLPFGVWILVSAATGYLIAHVAQGKALMAAIFSGIGFFLLASMLVSMLVGK